MSDQDPTNTPPLPPPPPPSRLPLAPGVAPHEGFRPPGQAGYPPGTQLAPGTQFKPGTQFTPGMYPGSPRPKQRWGLLVTGMLLCLLGVFIGMLPGGLFILGGGGNTDRFMEQMRPVFTTGAALTVLGVLLLVLGAKLPLRSTRRGQ